MTRVLSVGRYLSSATDSVSWFPEEDVNMKDYNIVFLDLHQLDKQYDRSSDESISDLILPTAKNVEQHLKAGNVIVASLPSSVEKQISSRKEFLFEWLPLGLNITHEPGESVDEESIRDSWSWYFTGDEFQWHLHFMEGTETVGSGKHNTKWFKSSAIVKNEFDRSIAAEIKIGESPEGMSRHFWDGSVYLIPVLSGWSTDDLKTKILQNNLLEQGSHPEQESTPNWVGEYTVPEESETEENITEIESEIESLEDELREKQNNLENIRGYKALLFGNESRLEQLIPSVFEELGFSVDGEESHGRDAEIKLEDRTIIVEITGTTGGISHKKCGQLDRWVRDCELDDPEGAYEGLLVVNPFRETEPKERSGYLSPDVVEIMEKWGYKIITTHYVFDIFVKFRCGDLNKNDIRQRLINEETVLDID